MAQLRKTGYGDQGVTVDFINFMESDQSRAVEMAGIPFSEFRGRTLAGS
jgi:hypothetical protein